MGDTSGVDLNNVAAFVRAIEAGSISAAARALGLPKSSVSRRVAALESALGVRLIQRGPRNPILTDAGRAYFEQVREGLGRIAGANAAASDTSREVAGPIRFTAAGDNTGFLAKLIAEFLQRYPKVQIDVVLTSRRVDLVNEGVDVALRPGPLIDSALVVRRLGRTDLGLFASPAYLREAGTLRLLSDLTRHRFVLFSDPSQGDEVRLAGPAGQETVKVAAPLVVHDMQFAADAIAAGVGIGLVPEAQFSFAASGLNSAYRSLMRVLPEYRVPGAELSLVSPPTAYEPTRVGLFRDFLVERMRPLLDPVSGGKSRSP